MALLAMYSMALLCVFVIEQPQNSQAENHPRLASLFERYSIFRSGIWGANYANDTNCSAKRHWLYSNDSMLLQRLSDQAGHLAKEKRDALTVNLVKKQKRADGSWTWSGDRSTLKASQYLV